MSDNSLGGDQPILSVTGARRADGCLLICVAGELDISTVVAFGAQVTRLLAGDHDRLELDLAGVGFCDVAGSRELLHLCRQAVESKTELTLVASSRPVEDLMKLLDIADWPPVA